MTPSTG